LVTRGLTSVGVAAALGAGAGDEVAVTGEPAGVGSGSAAGDGVVDAEVPAKRALGTSRMVRRAAREGGAVAPVNEPLVDI
jgi:hypothetical protein